MRRALVTLFIAGGCTSHPVVATAPNVPPAHMLFRVSGQTGPTVFILGSVHQLPEQAGTLPWQVDSAFARAKTIAFEASLDTLQQRGMEVFARAKLPAGTTLKDVITARTYAWLDSIAPAYKINLAQLATYKPWMVSLVFTQAILGRANFKPQYGVDLQLNARAKRAGKRVIGLETVDFQIGLLDGVSAADQELMLANQTASPDSAVQELRKIATAWTTGDTASVNKALNDNIAKSPTLFAMLLTERNQRWVPQIEAMLRGTDDVLVVVGTAHLVGRVGVIEHLRRKGYSVSVY